MMDELEDTSIYVVVMNHEEQYSVWPAGRLIPAGWNELDKRGSKQECLAYIKEVWTDMRPLSLRRAMDAQKSAAPAPKARAGRGSRPSKPAKPAKRR